MFYSWTDIENLGYDNVEDFANEEMRRHDYERVVATPEGIEIIRKQYISDFKPAPSVRKKPVRSQIFPLHNYGNAVEEFNTFCEENSIQEENIIHITYRNDHIFLVYKEN